MTPVLMVLAPLILVALVLALGLARAAAHGDQLDRDAAQHQTATIDDAAWGADVTWISPREGRDR